MRISDWSSDVCSSDLAEEMARAQAGRSDDPAVAAALAFALKVVEDRGQVGDADVQRLRDAGYGDEQVMESLAHVALNIFTHYTNVAFGVPVDFPAGALLPRFCSSDAGSRTGTGCAARRATGGGREAGSAAGTTTSRLT